MAKVFGANSYVATQTFEVSPIVPASPTLGTHAASKDYVDLTAAGLDIKASVRAATTAAGTLASSFENGDTIDGVVLATGNRILIKDQASATENGIYTVAASGAPTRATDMAAGSHAAGAFTFVEEGTANGDKGFVCSSNASVDLVGTDALTWSQFSAFTPLSDVAPVNVTKAAASAGTASEASRQDHKHDVSTAAAVSATASTTNTEGSASSLARSDHTHAVPTAAPGAVAIGDAASAGSSASLARADHVHSVAAPSAPADVTKAAASAGASANAARQDHKHNVSTAAPGQGIGGSNAEGSATSLARSDHDHTLRETGGPTNLTIGSIVSGEFLKRVGTAIVSAAASVGLVTKAGVVASGSFAGNPKTAAVAFGVAFADNNYSIALGLTSTSGTGYSPSINSKTSAGFTINMNVNNIAALTEVYWTATKHGETT